MDLERRTKKPLRDGKRRPAPVPREVLINRLYAELHLLRSRAATDPSLKDEVQAKLALLRKLQSEEAEEMRRRSDARLLLTPEEALQALERAREVLARYENPATTDIPTRPKS
jgi:TfoX/Sxy family transcriptional regulator of competence genes